MGVPHLAYYYYQKYNKQNELLIDSNILSKNNSENLFFDFNSLIHPCAQQILSANKDKYIKNKDIDIIEKDIIKNCLNYTKLIMDIVCAKNVYIMIDGVAPKAKIQQQRERRYKSQFFKIEDIDDNSEKSELWDSNKITPGTNFMNKLSTYLIDFKQDVKDDFNIFISDANQPGEGEHKIMKIINTLSIKSNSLIYGLDGDLLFLSLLKEQNIILIRDNTFNIKLNDTHISKTIDYLNITHLKQYIYKHLSEQFNLKGIININKENLILDYVLICFLLGNDFLEHLPSLSIKKGGVDTIIKAYINSWKGKNLVDLIKLKNKNDFKECINLIFLKDLFYQLKNHESYFFKKFKYEELIQSEAIMLEKISNQNENVKFYSNNIIYNGELNNIKQKYYLYYGIYSDTINQSCFNYIEGLYWILGYYYNHENTHNNWDWCYHYNNSLFTSDIFEYLRLNISTLQQNIINTKSLNKSKVFSNIKQLCLVLPKQSLITILKELNYDKLTLLETTILNYTVYYPNNIYVDTINKKYLWQSKIFFKNIDDNIFDLF